MVVCYRVNIAYVMHDIEFYFGIEIQFYLLFIALRAACKFYARVSLIRF